VLIPEEQADVEYLGSVCGGGRPRPPETKGEQHGADMSMGDAQTGLTGGNEEEAEDSGWGQCP